MIESAISAFSI